MTRVPNKNAEDACCRCGRILKTEGAAARVLDQVADDELLIHQPNVTDPPQFMCGKCAKEVAEP